MDQTKGSQTNGAEDPDRSPGLDNPLEEFTKADLDRVPAASPKPENPLVRLQSQDSHQSLSAGEQDFGLELGGNVANKPFKATEQSLATELPLW